MGKNPNCFGFEHQTTNNNWLVSMSIVTETIRRQPCRSFAAICHRDQATSRGHPAAALQLPLQDIPCKQLAPPLSYRGIHDTSAALLFVPQEPKPHGASYVDAGSLSRASSGVTEWFAALHPHCRCAGLTMRSPDIIVALPMPEQ